MNFLLPLSVYTGVFLLFSLTGMVVLRAMAQPITGHPIKWLHAWIIMSMLQFLFMGVGVTLAKMVRHGRLGDSQALSIGLGVMIAALLLMLRACLPISWLKAAWLAVATLAVDAVFVVAISFVLSIGRGFILC